MKYIIVVLCVFGFVRFCKSFTVRGINDMKYVRGTHFPHLLSVHLGKKFSPIIVATSSAQFSY